QFACRLDDDRYLDLELGRYRSSNVGCVLRWRTRRSAEDGIATVEQGSHALVAQTGEQDPQLGHGKAPGLADVDASQENDERGHLRRPPLGLRFLRRFRL